VKHPPKKVQKLIIPGESYKDPKILNNAMTIEELKKSKAAQRLRKQVKPGETGKARSPLQEEERCKRKI